MAGEESSEMTPRRVVIIGASNVALGIGSLIATCSRAWGQPLEHFLAAGHGRALGTPSRVLGRELPAVLDCQLWENLHARPRTPTAALVTDLGTDLIFGASAQQVVDRAAECLRRLRPQCDRLVVTQLPETTVAKMSPRAFRFARRFLFPSSRLLQEEAITAIRAINEALLQFPSEFDCYLARPDPSWFGIDPVHLRRRCYPDAWRHFLSPWCEFKPMRRSRQVGALRTLGLWKKLRPAQRVVRGKPKQTTQPCAQTADGSTFWLY